MPYKDPEQRRAYRRQYQAKNFHKYKEYYRLKRAERSRQIKVQFHIFKEMLSCALCPENDEIALDFHHLDPTEKELCAHDMVSNGIGWKQVVAEIEKCICLCANCHRKVHKHKSWAKRITKQMLIVVPDDLRNFKVKTAVNGPVAQLVSSSKLII